MPTSSNFLNIHSGEKALTAILDGMDALVYVADIHTYELIFLNKFGRKHWGQINNRKCYEVLQKEQSAPCAFCTNSQLLDNNGNPTGKTHVWEFQNTVTGRWYQCRDQAITWIDNRLVRIEIAVDISERKQLEHELRAAHHKAETLANLDGLTNIYNRRAFFVLGQQVLNSQSHLPTSLLMIDLDHFKRINDNHGHAAGDSVLTHIVNICRTNLRDTDIFARLGGEEFSVLLPKTDLQQANDTAERLRKAIANTPLLFNGNRIHCTASFGIAHYQPSTPLMPSTPMLLDELLSLADSQLYNAKKNGRNRIISASLTAS